MFAQFGFAHLDNSKYFFLIFWRKSHDHKIGILCIHVRKFIITKIFAAKSDRFHKAEFQAELTETIDLPNLSYKQKISSSNREFTSLTKDEGGSELAVTLLRQKQQEAKVPNEHINELIGKAINEIIFSPQLPISFIASAERTGAAIFRRELDFARNCLLEEMSQSERNIDSIKLLFDIAPAGYALPVRRNVDAILKALRNKKVLSPSIIQTS